MNEGKPEIRVIRCYIKGMEKSEFHKDCAWILVCSQGVPKGGW